jgi:hypothetical protein
MRRFFSFTAKIWKWPGQAGWHFVHVPREYFEPVREKYGKGMIKVVATIGKTTWDTSLFPLTKDRSLLVCIKAKVRKTEDLMAGDEITLRIKIL